MSSELDEVLSGLKPSDVMIDSSGRIVLKDAELAKRVRELGADAPMADTNFSDCNHNCHPTEQ
ncbi:hypothetical protein [Streptomyces eurythermus]|uniref:hypothetical protein n=1 Tax=Streptomyces eurythermus TaxID=42237 RepID=UPI0036F83C4F